MQPSLELLTGKPISHAWLGHGSALFLELGTLTESQRRDGSKGNPKGEITVMADFGWRIEGPRSILCGSGESKARITSSLKRILDASIVQARVNGRLPELQLELSSGLWLQTFCKYQGQPTWTILFNAPDLGALGVKAGRVVSEPASRKERS